MDKVFTIKLTEAELSLVVEAIGTMPLNRVVNVFARIQQQIAEQQNSPTPAQIVAAREAANGHEIKTDT